MIATFHFNAFWSIAIVSGFIAYLLIAESAAHLYLRVMDYLLGDEDSGQL